MNSKLHLMSTKSSSRPPTHLKEGSDSSKAKEMYENLVKADDDPFEKVELISEIKEFKIENSPDKENQKPVSPNVGDRFIPNLDISQIPLIAEGTLIQSQEEQSNTIFGSVSKGEFQHQNYLYQGMLVTQMNSRQKRVSFHQDLGRQMRKPDKEKIQNMIQHGSSLDESSLAFDLSSSENEIKKIVNGRPTVESCQIPQRIQRFGPKQTDQMESETCFNGEFEQDRRIIRQFYSQSQQRSNIEEKVRQQLDEGQLRFKVRKRLFKLPAMPFKVLAAPEVENAMFQTVLDWAPQTMPEFPNATSGKIALALHDTIHITDPLCASSGKSTIEYEPHITALSFDRCGGILTAGTTRAQVAIFDVNSSKKVRDLSCHSKQITTISHLRSACAPYLVATGSLDKTIVFHDLRKKFSVINQIRTHSGEITRLEWSCNQTPNQLQESDPTKIHLFSASNSLNQEVALWCLRDLNYARDDKPRYEFFDDLSHSSPIKAMSWCPQKQGLFVTGGSERDDAVIRVFDMNNLSESTKGNDQRAVESHADVIHSIKCNSTISSLNWRKTPNVKDLELISTHGQPDNEIKLWQINKNTHDNIEKCGKKVQYWFTKIKEWRNVHDLAIIDSILSPDSSTLATLSGDETLRFWKMFESFDELNSKEPSKKRVSRTPDIVKMGFLSSNSLR